MDGRGLRPEFATVVQKLDVIYLVASDGRGWLTVPEIAAGVSCSDRAVRKRVEELVELGILTSRTRVSGDEVHPQEYALRDRQNREETTR
jgi:DNA-binding Lrp family transcriptional regulator